jgi:hypothetical protein
MTNRSIAAFIPCKRVVLAVVASALLTVASPLAATSSAASGGAHKPVSAGHGDCKNNNSGKHKGYDCPVNDGGGDDSSVVVIDA